MKALLCHVWSCVSQCAVSPVSTLLLSSVLPFMLFLFVQPRDSSASHISAIKAEYRMMFRQLIQTTTSPIFFFLLTYKLLCILHLLLNLIRHSCIFECHFALKHLRTRLLVILIFPTARLCFPAWNSQSWSNPEPAWRNVSLPVQWAAHSGWEYCPVTVGISVWWLVCVLFNVSDLFFLLFFVCAPEWADKPLHAIINS